MLTLILLVALGALILRIQAKQERPASLSPIAAGVTGKIAELWKIAQSSIREQKYLKAEKALLTILKVDERNATAYNRLGILYAKQRSFADAIECFEIAQSLEPSASSLHNVGLIYFETGQYDKAAIAFEQAIEMESELAARHIAYAKVQEKLGDHKKMIIALRKAVDLEPNPQSLKILADAYDRTGDTEMAEEIKKKLEQHTQQQPAQPIPQQVRRPRRIMM